MSIVALNSQDSFVPTVLPRRVTFGQWLYSSGLLQSEMFVNNHYVGHVTREIDGSVYMSNQSMAAFLGQPIGVYTDLNSLVQSLR